MNEVYRLHLSFREDSFYSSLEKAIESAERVLPYHSGVMQYQLKKLNKICWEIFTKGCEIDAVVGIISKHNYDVPLNITKSVKIITEEEKEL